MRLITSMSMIGICLGMSVAAHAADFEDTARVMNVTPQVERVNTPRQECRTEYVPIQQQPQQQQQQRGVGGSIIGGIAGGILGNQVGGGSGRTAATAAGAIAGAIMGDRIENNNESGSTATTTTTEQPVRQCKMVDSWETRNAGYQVTYEYHGRTYTTVMPYDPGRHIKLHVSLTPR